MCAFVVRFAVRPKVRTIFPRLPFFFPGLFTVVICHVRNAFFFFIFLSGFCCTGKTGRKSKPYRELKWEHLLVHLGPDRLRGFVRVLVGCVPTHVRRRVAAVGMQHMFVQRVSRSQCLSVKARCRASPGRAAGGTSVSNVNAPLLIVRVPNMLSLEQVCQVPRQMFYRQRQTGRSVYLRESQYAKITITPPLHRLCYTGVWRVLLLGCTAAVVLPDSLYLKDIYYSNKEQESWASLNFLSVNGCVLH